MMRAVRSAFWACVVLATAVSCSEEFTSADVDGGSGGAGGSGGSGNAAAPSTGGSNASGASGSGGGLQDAAAGATSVDADRQAFGDAIRWTGGCAEQLSASPSILFSGAKFTVEAWLELESGGGQWQILVYRGGNAVAAPAGWTFELAQTADDPSAYVLQLCGSDGLGAHACVASSSAITVGKPYHIAAVRVPAGVDCGNGSLEGCVRFYIGAAEFGFAHNEEILPFPIDWSTAEPLRLAAGAECTSYPTRAVVDELRMWSVQRSLADLDADASRSIGCSTQRLEAYYRFDEAGNELLDCTGITGSAFALGAFNHTDSPFDD